MPGLKAEGNGRVTLRGELESFSQRTEDGWGFGTLLVEGEVLPVKITGKLLGAKPGESLECTGLWIEHATYGLQFKVLSTVIHVPCTAEGVAKWLQATLPGVGPKRAAALIEHFGSVDALWNVIEHEPARLCEVPGITTTGAQDIHTAYMRSRDSRDHMVALRGWGLTDNQIQRCLKEWRTLDAIVKRIKQNPYQLCHHVSGFGFKRADEVARLAGVQPNSPERVEAGIVYTLDNVTYEGHCWMWGGQLQRVAANETLHVSMDDVAHGIERATKNKLITRRAKRIYGARMEAIEHKGARGLEALHSPAPANDNGAPDGRVFNAEEWFRDVMNDFEHGGTGEDDGKQT